MQDHRTDIWQHSNTVFTSDTLELGGKNKQLYELLYLQFLAVQGAIHPTASGSGKDHRCRLGGSGSIKKPNKKQL